MCIYHHGIRKIKDKSIYAGNSSDLQGDHSSWFESADMVGFLYIIYILSFLFSSYHVCSGVHDNHESTRSFDQTNKSHIVYRNDKVQSICSISLQNMRVYTLCIDLSLW